MRKKKINIVEARSSLKSKQTLNEMNDDDDNVIKDQAHKVSLHNRYKYTLPRLLMVL